MYAKIGFFSLFIFCAMLTCMYINNHISIFESFISSSIIASNFCIAASAVFALKEYDSNEKQKALTNALFAVDKFYDSLHPGDIDAFKKIIVANGEAAGGDNNGRFMGEDGELHNFSGYFTEGAELLDGLALDRIVSSLERTCFLALNNCIAGDVLFLELGHFIHIAYVILKAINISENNLLNNFPSINKIYLQYNEKNIPYKRIGYIE